MSPTYRLVGFGLSGVLHFALVAVVLGHNPIEAPPTGETEQPLVLDLSLFELPSASPPEVTISEPEPVLPMPDLPTEPPPIAETAAPPVSVQNSVQAQETFRKVPQQKPLQPVKRKPEPEPVTTPPPKQVEISQRTAAQPPIGQVVATAPQVVAEPISSTSDNQPKTTDPSIDAIKAAFLAALSKRIDRAKSFPKTSRRRGEQGTVVVSFVVQKNGSLSDVRVVTSSGYRRLDQSALNTLAKVSPFQPIPDSLQRDSWPISVPIAYALRR